MSKSDKFSIHEALDRTYILSMNLETALGDNQIVLSDPKAKELYEKASKNINELYQYLGGITDELDNA